MQHVYVVTEDMYVLGLRSSNTITDVHENTESAENEINTYMLKNDLLEGYHIVSDVGDEATHKVVLTKWFGILKRIIVANKRIMRDHG